MRDNLDQPGVRKGMESRFSDPGAARPGVILQQSRFYQTGQVETDTARANARAFVQLAPRGRTSLIRSLEDPEEET